MNKNCSSERRGPVGSILGRLSLRWLSKGRLSLGLIFVMAVGCSKPPQLGGDEASLVFSDALWTAVTSRDMALVDGCEQQLQGAAPRSGSRAIWPIICSR